MQPQPTLYSYWLALYNRKRTILTVSLLGPAFALVISILLPPVYEAKASFYLPANLKSPSYTADPAQQDLSQQPLVPLLEEANASLHIGILGSDDIINKMTELFPDRSSLFFRKNVDVVTSPELFVDIYVRDRDPRMAAEIANSYSDVYEEFHAGMLSAKAAKTFQTMEGELAELDKAIEKRSTELLHYKETHSLISSTDLAIRLSEQQMDMENDLNLTKIDLIASRERLKELRSQYEAEIKKGHAKVIDSIRQALLLEESEEKYLEAKFKALTESLELMTESTRDTLPILMKVETLSKEVDILEEMRMNVKRNLAEAYLQREFPVVMTVNVQRAVAPSRPAFPRPILNAIVALLFGFAASCYYALFLEYLNKIKAHRVERNLLTNMREELQQ